jgi:hypothetical protein
MPPPIDVPRGKRAKLTFNPRRWTMPVSHEELAAQLKTTIRQLRAKFTDEEIFNLLKTRIPALFEYGDDAVRVMLREVK